MKSKLGLVKLGGLLVLFGVLSGAPGAAFAQAATTCQAVFERPVFEYADLGLTHPEIEAKFSSNQPIRLKRLKNLIGKTLALEGPEGERLEYAVEFSAKSVYRDIYYDTADLKLLNSKSLLRRRTRFDHGEEKYDFVKGVHHAKGNFRQIPGLEVSIVARDEVRGTEFKKRGKFDQRSQQIIEGVEHDEAVSYANGLLSPGESLQPVLYIEDFRYFVKLKPLQKGAPEFYVSIDRVQYRRWNGAFGERVEVEAEIKDDLTKDSNKKATYKVKVLSALSRYMRREFGLQSAPESKYETGMTLTAGGVMPRHD